MASTDANEWLERLAELLVLAEVSDPRALADVHSAFDPIEVWATDNSQPLLVAAANHCKTLIESIILEDVDNPVSALDVVGKVVASLQLVIRDGRDPNNVWWPEELQPPPQAAPSNCSTSGPPLPKGLPPHIDASIFADFLARQTGVLDDYEQLVLAIERESNPESVNALRRLIHTLKGEAGLLALPEVEHLAHAMEDCLASRPVVELADGLLAFKDWLGRTFDYYRGNGGVPGSPDRVLKAIGIKTEEKQAPQPDDSDEGQALQGDPDLLKEFVAEANDHLEKADLHLLTLETNQGDQEAINAVFRAFHTIKGVAGFLGLEQVLSLAHEAENLLDMARKGDLILTGAAMDSTFDSVDMLKKMIAAVADSLVTGSLLPRERGLPALLEELRSLAAKKIPVEQDPFELPSSEPGQRLGEILVNAGSIVPDAVDRALGTQQDQTTQMKIGLILVEQGKITRKQLDDALHEQQEKASSETLGEILIRTGAIGQKDVDEALRAQEQTQEHPPLGEILVTSGEAAAKEVAQALRSQKMQQQPLTQMKEPVKVDADRLDQLIDMIGELVIAESMVVQSRDLKDLVSAELSRQLGQLDKITRELQEMGTSLRMVPIRSTFQKMARLVRDLAKKSGKQIEFSTSGEETELDKTVIDKIGDPLVHMVRNAVDHGIEHAEDRKRSGKDEAGRVHLRAFHKGGNIYVEIEDDGRGLDREAILAKAIERGIVRPDEQLTDREIMNLIFMPGFSTAKTITDISGRGVGMDVVKRNVEMLRGQAEIQSKLGEGTTFTIRLPLTLAIIDGMVVRVGADRYIIPTLSIVTSIRPEQRQLSSVAGRGQMLSLQGRLLPLFRLADLFCTQSTTTDATEGILVIVEDEGRQTALLVDEILGRQQIVIKSLGDTFQGISGLAGGAIMPDGTVGLILDVGGLVRTVNAA